MAFVTLNGTTVRVFSNAASEKYNEHGLDRERMFNGEMRMVRRGIYRQWDLTTPHLSNDDANTLIAILTSNTLPLLMQGDLCGADCAAMPILVSNDPVHTANGFRRRVVFTLHETPAALPPDTSANVWLFWRRGTGLFQELDGTVPSLDGDPIGYWTDQSGHARHMIATQTGGPDTRPTNDTGAARFPDGTPWLNVPSDFQFLGEAELMIRLRADFDPPLSGQDLHCRLHNLGDNGAGVSLYPALDGHVYEMFGVGVLADVGNLSTDLTEWNVYNPSATVANGQVVRMNNVTVFSDPMASINFGTPDYHIGGALPNVNNSWFGNISDVLIIEGELTTSQRASWYDYMRGDVDDPPLP